MHPANRSTSVSADLHHYRHGFPANRNLWLSKCCQVVCEDNKCTQWRIVQVKKTWSQGTNAAVHYYLLFRSELYASYYTTTAQVNSSLKYEANTYYNFISRITWEKELLKYSQFSCAYLWITARSPFINGSQQSHYRREYALPASLLSHFQCWSLHLYLAEAGINFRITTARSPRFVQRKKLRFLASSIELDRMNSILGHHPLTANGARRTYCMFLFKTHQRGHLCRPWLTWKDCKVSFASARIVNSLFQLENYVSFFQEMR